MSQITDEALKILVPALVTCGGDVGMLYPVAQSLIGKSGGKLEEMLPAKLSPQAQRSLEALRAESTRGQITPQSVIKRYGLPKHFREMLTEAESNLPSVAGEFPSHIRPVIHTVLPLKNGVYQNGSVNIRLKNLVPLGKQEGILVAHLAGVFASGCTESEIEKLLRLQSQDSTFMKLAAALAEVDYQNTTLQTVTLRAKKSLHL